MNGLILLAVVVICDVQRLNVMILELNEISYDQLALSIL